MRGVLQYVGRWVEAVHRAVRVCVWGGYERVLQYVGRGWFTGERQYVIVDAVA